MCNINDLLSNREIAILIWGLFYFIYVMRSLSARKSVVNVFIELWKAKKALTVFVLFPTLIGILLLSRIIEIDLGMWKEILIWVVTSALLSFSFEINKVKSIKGYFKVLMKIMLSIPLVWFVVDFTYFSIWWELLIVLVSFFLTKLYFFEELNQEENRDVKKLVRFFYYGFFVVWGYSLYKTIQNPEFWSIETFQTFIIMPLLTTIYALLSYLILLIVNYESSFEAINEIIDTKSRSIYRYKIWAFCRFNLNKICHCDFYMYNRTKQSSETLKYTIDSAITSYRKQKNKYEIQNN